MSILGAVARLIAPAGRRSRLSVLIFHRVLPRFDPFAPHMLDAERFERILEGVSRCFNVLAPDEAVERLRRGTLPDRPLAITFDDGYADNVEVALPILLRHRLPAGFFIATDYLDGGTMWNDAICIALRRTSLQHLDLGALGFGAYGLDTDAARRRAMREVVREARYLPAPRRQEAAAAIVDKSGVVVPRNLMMESPHLRTLRAAGMVLGGHTCSHPVLATLPLREAEREIAQGRARIEAIVGEPVTLFAYPNGTPGTDYRDEHVQLVKRLGFRGAFSTAWGVAGAGSDPYQLPRFTPWDASRGGFVSRLIGNMVRPGMSARRVAQ